jgi:gas vesicle protein
MVADVVPWYLSPNFLPAAFGLLGVIVGGLITAVSTYLLDERRSTREREQEERDGSTEIKRAARMIDADLSAASAFSSIACENNYYWSSGSVPLKLKGWDDYAAIIASAVLSDAWLKIRVGIKAVRHLNEYREFDASVAVGQSLFPPLSSSLKPAVALAVHDISNAREALAPLCDDSQPAASGS